MKQIDLEPKNYRIVGIRRPKRRLQNGAMLWVATFCGIWAASVLWICRYYIHGEDAFVAAAITFAPALVFMLYAVLTDPS